jgi:Mn-dependent DtxR family transcriptional regulator
LVYYQNFIPCAIKNPGMDNSCGAGLSARKVDYLKYIHEHDGSVRTGDLAARFGVDPSTISKTIRELAQDGFLSCAPYQRIRLSAYGKREAEYCIKRHRILSLLFTHYGFSPEQACSEVSRFESYVSRDAVDQICRTMGHPQAAGCGAITHDAGCLGEGKAPEDLASPDPIWKGGQR